MNDYERYEEQKKILERDYEEALTGSNLIGVYDYIFLNRCEVYKTSVFIKYEKCDTFTELMSNMHTSDIELLKLVDRLEKQYKALKYNQSLEEVEKAFYNYKKKVEQNN